MVMFPIPVTSTWLSCRRMFVFWTHVRSDGCSSCVIFRLHRNASSGRAPQNSVHVKFFVSRMVESLVAMCHSCSTAAQAYKQESKCAHEMGVSGQVMGCACRADAHSHIVGHLVPHVTRSFLFLMLHGRCSPSFIFCHTNGPPPPQLMQKPVALQKTHHPKPVAWSVASFRNKDCRFSMPGVPSTSVSIDACMPPCMLYVVQKWEGVCHGRAALPRPRTHGFVWVSSVGNCTCTFSQDGDQQPGACLGPEHSCALGRRGRAGSVCDPRPRRKTVFGGGPGARPSARKIGGESIGAGFNGGAPHGQRTGRTRCADDPRFLPSQPWHEKCGVGACKFFGVHSRQAGTGIMNIEG